VSLADRGNMRLAPVAPGLTAPETVTPAVWTGGVLDPDTLFIQKPFSPAALGHKVRAALDRVSRPV
jgi:hypothetical protein